MRSGPDICFTQQTGGIVYIEWCRLRLKLETPMRPCPGNSPCRERVRRRERSGFPPAKAYWNPAMRDQFRDVRVIPCSAPSVKASKRRIPHCLGRTLRPVLRGVNHSEDMHHVRLDAVHDDVGQRGDEKLTGAFLLSDAAAMRRLFQ